MAFMVLIAVAVRFLDCRPSRFGSVEPLSLGYFSVLMAIYYAALFNGRLMLRFGAIGVCLLLALLSDSRAASGLIVLSSLVLLPRLKWPSAAIWLAPVGVLFAAWLVYFRRTVITSGIRWSACL
jgi:hypothetical protein